MRRRFVFMLNEYTALVLDCSCNLHAVKNITFIFYSSILLYCIESQFSECLVLTFQLSCTKWSHSIPIISIYFVGTKIIITLIDFIKIHSGR